jgi:hypothetical protein
MTARRLATLPTIAALRRAGCGRILIKLLAENDNSKNQIYLGGSFDVLNSLPLDDWRVEGSPSREIIKASIAWQWLQRDGTVVTAPKAQLILYPQYPEVRLSGVLRSVPRGAAPSDLIASRTPGRILLMGLTSDSRVVAVTLSPESPESEAVRAMCETLTGPGALKELEAPEVSSAASGSRAILLEHLLRVHEQHWISGSRLRSDGVTVPYGATNGVGYTLEAQLGIRPNGRSEPDFLGWEVKGLSAKRPGPIPKSKRVTLMTPSPTGGDFSTLGPIGFVGRYGHPDAKDPSRRNFGGMFRSGSAIGDHQLSLTVDGFDRTHPDKFSATGAIRLLRPDSVSAVEWSLAKMIEHWNLKHAKAVYVPAIAEGVGTARRYWFGDTVHLGVGTDFARLLTAMASGQLVYDPGLKVEQFGLSDEKLKQRHQFRISFGNLPQLYASWETVNLASAAT